MPLSPERTDYRDYPEYLSVDVPIEEVRPPSLPFDAGIKEGATHIRHTVYLGAEYEEGKRHFWERRWAVRETDEPEPRVNAAGYRRLLRDNGVPLAPVEKAWAKPMTLWVASEQYAAVVGTTQDESQGRVTLIRAETPPLGTYRTLPTGNSLADGLETRFLTDSLHI